MTSIVSAKSIRILLSLLFIVILFYFNYFLERTQFQLLILLFGSAFGIYIALIFTPLSKLKNHFKWMIGLGILARVMILFALPNLSNDYFRFIWDGHLTMNGISPFEYLPSELAEIIGIKTQFTTSLYQNMNSPNYYSVYPAIHQYFFAFSNFLFPNSIFGNIVILKSIMLIFELISIATLYQLAIHFKKNIHVVLLYVLNPLVIIEFCGNLHFEGILITFLLLTLYLFTSNSWKLSAFTFAGAILTKIHPIMLLPFIVKYLGWKKGLLFSILSCAITVVLFFPFLTPIKQTPVYLSHILSSLKLYYESFEFNGGIYYILRWVGQSYYGYNPIQIVGKVMLTLNILILFFLFLKQQKGIRPLISNIVLAYLGYVLLSTTVHPWYILILLPFALLIEFKTPFVWSGVIILSYFAYSTLDWHENFYLLIVEYIFVFFFLIYEYKNLNILNENNN